MVAVQLMSHESTWDSRSSNVWFPYIRNYGYYDPVMAGSIDGTDDAPHDRAIVRALSARYKPNHRNLLSTDPKAVLFLGRLPYTADCKMIRHALQKISRGKSSSQSSGRSKHHHSQKKGHAFTDPQVSRRSRSPFAASSIPHLHATRDPCEDVDDGIWPKIRLVRNLVTGFPCGYGFAYFRSHDEADHVLQKWLQKVRSHTDKRNQNLGGLDIPGGEKVILEPAFSETLPGWKPRRLGGGLGGRKEAGQLRFGGVARPFRRPFNM